jgi:hypothetical protein
VTLEEARPVLEPALAYAGGTHTYDDVCSLVEEGRLQYWHFGRSAVVTEILQYPRKKILSFFLAGGNLAELHAMLPGLLEWGRSEGCTEAFLTGRAGWTRSFLARQEGWESGLVLMTKAI